MRTTLILYLLCSSCGPDECWTNSYGDTYSHYKIDNIRVTPILGIKVDDTGQNIDLNVIDQKTMEAEECLQKFGERLPLNVSADAYCPNALDMMDTQLCLRCITVKIPNDWLMSCDGKEQVLPNEAPQQGCDAKGFKRDDNCPCRWREVIQDRTILVTTPNLTMYKDLYVRYKTGCYDNWNSKELLECIQ